MIVAMVAMRMMQMAVVKIVNVVVVLDREMTTARAVRVLVFRYFGTSRDDRSPCRGDHLSRLWNLPNLRPKSSHVKSTRVVVMGQIWPDSLFSRF